MKKRNGIIFLVMLLAAGLLSGCLRGNATLDVASDGTALLTYKVLAAIPVKEEMDRLAKQNMQVEELQEDGQSGFIAKKQLGSLDELGQLGLFDRDGKVVNQSRIERGLFYDEQIFDLLYPGPQEEQNMTERARKERDSILEALDFSYTINLPAAAVEQNADTVAAEGRTLTWKMKMVSDTHIKATARVWHGGRVALAVLVAAALGGGYYYKKIRRTGQEA